VNSVLCFGLRLTPQEIFDSVARVFTHEVSFSAGGTMRFSLSSLLTAAFVFFVVIRISRTAQRLLHARVLSRVPMDSGLAYTLQRLLHYALLGLAVLVALRIGIGADFTSFAVVLTALSVGIGLGLKEISSDVAAGFVLLFERPVRVGDRVKLSSDLHAEGDIVAIGLRTTKILTNDRLMIIVPNSKLTNEECVNWSYSNAPVRLHIPIGVAYGSEVEAVDHALLAAATGVARLVEDPKPSVRLVRFGESSLDFELLVWTREPESHPAIRSDLNYNIYRELATAGVELPFPQLDLRVRSMPEGLVPHSEPLG
jgi:potassium-dependent mechanosensitive channel